MFFHQIARKFILQGLVPYISVRIKLGCEARALPKLRLWRLGRADIFEPCDYLGIAFHDPEILPQKSLSCPNKIPPRQSPCASRPTWLSVLKIKELKIPLWSSCRRSILLQRESSTLLVLDGHTRSKLKIKNKL